MHVAGGPNHPVIQFQPPGWPHQVAARRPVDVAAEPHRRVNAQKAGIRKSQLHLVVIAQWAEDADIGNHLLARAENRHCLLGGKSASLIQGLLHGQLGTRAEERVQCLID